MTVFCYKWNDADVYWNTVELTWAEFCVINKISDVIGTSIPQVNKKLKKLSKDEKRVLIGLVTRIKSNDIEFEKTQNKQKNNNVNIKISDVVSF